MAAQQWQAKMKLHVNGAVAELAPEISADMPLLWVLREHLGLTGTKYGCGHGVCGGCMVEVDGAQVHSCKVTVAEIQGMQVTTIEGQTGPVAEALFRAWDRLNVVQCGFCQPAQFTSAAILLKLNPRPTDADIDEAMKHNLCRCATYQRIRNAIKAAAAELADSTLEATS